MLSCAGSIFEATGKPNRQTQHDTGAASCAMALQATASGLMVHQMGGFDADKARAAFGIPAEYTPMAMIAVGYQAEPDILDEETKAKELRPRARKPLAERFYEGGWGQGYKGDGGRCSSPSSTRSSGRSSSAGWWGSCPSATRCRRFRCSFR